MVNANIVISVSAILVAVILTIVFVMRKNGDPADNFSVSVTGDIDGKPAGMYYCVGEDCQFYDIELNVPNDRFPGYFALVGFTIDGNTYLTEHSIKKTFKFDATRNLVDCFDAENLDTSLLAERVEGLKGAYKGGGKYTVDGNTFAVASYNLSRDPLLDSPNVLGFTVPSVEECKTVWSVPGVDFDEVNVDTPVVDNTPPSRRRNLSDDERALWNNGGQSSAWARKAAGIAYDGQGDSDHVVWNSCVTNTPFGGSAVARFIYHPSGTTMAISFAGSNDGYDWILDLSKSGSGNPSDLHWGFWKYVDLLDTCVTQNVNQLAAWGINIDMIIGHSLGGAAAVIYKDLHESDMSIRNSKLDTWAAPKTHFGGARFFSGNRRFDEKDPVAGNGMGLMSGLYHSVNNAQRGVQGSVCSNSFWGVCYSWRTTYSTQPAGAWDESGGCTWVADCLYNVGRHMLSSYANYGF